ncbi:MAG: hypothetical protein WA642_11260, partial [Steroidobacteraceae bacterium]
VESGHRHLLDSGVGGDHLIDLPLGGALVAARTAHAQVRFDTPAVGFAQPAIDVPWQQFPNIPVLGGRRL